jgi:protein TonB
MIAIFGPLRPQQRAAIPAALVCSVLAHIAAVALVAWITSARPQQRVAPVAREELARVVWIPMPGPGGGGGGRQAETPPPPRPPAPPPAQASAPPRPEPVATESATKDPEPLELRPAVAVPIASLAMPGVATAATPAAGGQGDGSGNGRGDGGGPGHDRGFGGDVYLPGNGVTSPIPVTRAAPMYTAEAVRARAQGVITVSCVVEPNGECGDVHIVRSFRPPFGLDEQAIAAARRWRFRPGMRRGEPVPVLVNLEIEFNIR